MDIVMRCYFNVILMFGTGAVSASLVPSLPVDS
jgi:hypothetical protein